MCVCIYIYSPPPLLCSLLTLITITFETRQTPNLSIAYIYASSVFICSFGKDIMASEPIVSPAGNSAALPHEQYGFRLF